MNSQPFQMPKNPPQNNWMMQNQVKSDFPAQSLNSVPFSPPQ